ncbi:MAG: A/G-specific adenine glycosylase [Bryobacterales bacterium]|nr:A/G-specific adenine glycosylase [Bryobacterales bacterium]
MRAPFRKALLAWYEAVFRDLPWRQTSDFYRVWISEIMLQQTRVEAVIPYYLRFLERFPTVECLAAAPEQDVLAAWSGLGYYSRARNLHRAAQQVAEGGVPSTHPEIAALAGIGPYTSAAIASIVLGLPHAAVDGNVIRVVSRLTNDASEISSPAARRRFGEIAQGLLDAARPGDFNQAMMELGATVCKPGAPLCGQCPVVTFCAARGAGTERELPVKLKKAKTRDVLLQLMIFRRADEVYLVQRDAGESRLAGFWELPDKSLFPRLQGRLAAEFTHQIVNDRFRVSVWSSRGSPELPEGRWTAVADLGGIPLATISRKALKAVPDMAIFGSTR